MHSVPWIYLLKRNIPIHCGSVTFEIVPIHKMPSRKKIKPATNFNHLPSAPLGSSWWIGIPLHVLAYTITKNRVPDLFFPRRPLDIEERLQIQSYVDREGLKKLNNYLLLSLFHIHPFFVNVLYATGLEYGCFSRFDRKHIGPIATSASLNPVNDIRGNFLSPSLPLS